MFIFAILMLIPALSLAQDPLAQLEAKIFSALDQNGDGKISKQENENVFLGFDSNKDGDVSKAEFKAALDKLDPSFAGHEDALYTLLDANNDVQVDKGDIDAAFALADKDSDGNLSKAEFHTAFQAVSSHVG